MNLKKLGILGIVAWLYFPTGTPDDIIALSLIQYLGATYIPIGIILLVLVLLKA